MTPEKAITTLELAISEVKWNYPLDYSIAFETAIEALEKQIPRKPIKSEREIRYCEVWNCPGCGFEFSGRVLNHCYSCGQALAWGEDEC